MKKNTKGPRVAGFACSNEAQAIVEFAVAVPFILLLLTGCIDFGRYMYDGILIGNAARAGVQYGSQNAIAARDSTGMIAAALADAGNLGVTPAATSCYCGGASASTCLTTSTITWNVTCPTDYIATFVQTKVTNTTPFKPLIGVPGLITSLTISRIAYAQVSP